MYRCGRLGAQLVFVVEVQERVALGGDEGGEGEVAVHCSLV